MNVTIANRASALLASFFAAFSLILLAPPSMAAPQDPTFGVVPLASQKGFIDETLSYQIWVQNNDKGKADAATLTFTSETLSPELTFQFTGPLEGTLGPRDRLDLDPILVTPKAGAQVGQIYPFQLNFNFSRPGVPDFPITIDCEYLVVDPVSITTTSPLPDWEVGVYDLRYLEATGGDGSYGWSVVSGELPDGLSLSGGLGTISGAPTTVETQIFTVRASDGATNWDERQFTLSTVSAPVQEVLPLPTQSNQETRNILIIPIGIDEPAPGYDYLNELFFTNTFSLNYYYQESSFNKVTFNPVGSGSDITPPYQYPGTTADSRHEIAAAAEAWAAGQGYDLSTYDLYYFLTDDTVGDGVGRIMRIYAFDMDSFSPQYTEHGLIHEVGHTFGLGHSNTLNPDGSIKLYGDKGSAMGAGSRAQIHGMHKLELGWIDQARMQTVEASGIYSLYRTEDWGDGTSVQLLKIVDPNTLLVHYVEYRVPIGFDATFGDYGGDHQYPNRLHIHRNEFSHLGTILEDTLATGESWTEPLNSAFTIQLLSQDGVSAQVEVTFPPGHTPAPPPIFNTPIATVTPSAFQSTSVAETALEYTILLNNVDTGSTLVGRPVLDAITYDPNFLTVVHKQRFGSLELDGLSGRLPKSVQIIQPLAAGGSPGFLGGGNPFVITSKPGTPLGQYPVVFDIHMTREGGNTSTFQVTLIYEVAVPYPSPAVTITSPADGSRFGDNVSIAFAGSADDTNGGDVSASLVWTSDLVGVIGNGPSFSTMLAAGYHEITATAVDGEGNLGSAVIYVDVFTPQPCRGKKCGK